MWARAMTQWNEATPTIPVDPILTDFIRRHAGERLEARFSNEHSQYFIGKPWALIITAPDRETIWFPLKLYEPPAAERS